MKLINNFATKSSLTGRWVGISAENWRISGEIVTKNIKCCRQTGNRGGHFVFWDIEPEMLGHNPVEVPGHRPVILLSCKRTLEIWRSFGPHVVPSCFACVWQDVRTEWPYQEKDATYNLCHIAVVQTSVAIPDERFVEIAFRWNCPRCYEHMKNQEQLHQFADWPSVITFHCSGCAQHMHDCIEEIVDKFQLRTSLASDVYHDFVCPGCAPLFYLVGGVYHSSSPYSFASNKQFDVRNVNREYRIGTALSDQLPVSLCEMVIADMKKDDAYRMNLLVGKNLYDCRCSYCCTFEDFIPMTNLSIAEIDRKINERIRCRPTRIAEKVQRCNRLWAYYQLYIRLQYKDCEMPQRVIQLVSEG